LPTDELNEPDLDPTSAGVGSPEHPIEHEHTDLPEADPAFGNPHAVPYREPTVADVLSHSVEAEFGRHTELLIEVAEVRATNGYVHVSWRVSAPEGSGLDDNAVQSIVKQIEESFRMKLVK
jgi:hypothetical protein